MNRNIKRNEGLRGRGRLGSQPRPAARDVQVAARKKHM